MDVKAEFRKSVFRHFAPLVDVYKFHGPIEEGGGGVFDVSIDYFDKALVISIWVDRAASGLLLSFFRNLWERTDLLQCEPQVESYLEVSEVLKLLGADGRLTMRQRYLSQMDIDAEVAWCFTQVQLLLPILTEYYGEILRKVRQMR